MVHADDKGLVLPPNVACIQVSYTKTASQYFLLFISHLGRYCTLRHQCERYRRRKEPAHSDV